MRILYGVQGTGNGHTTRARIMAKAFAAAGIDVDWIFSGRERDAYFDMDIFGNFQSYRGLTFQVKQGRVLLLKTALHCNLNQFRRDIKKINVEGYDFIINDFEPVSAWAAKRAGKKVIGISHQNSFLYDIPKQGSNIITEWFMRNFAPVTQPIGLHWHHFNQPILPPLVERSHYPNQFLKKHYLVYLPFSNIEDIAPQLRNFPDYQFYIYHNVEKASDDDHIHIRPFSREGFQQDLHRCEGVICSAGFELPSEALQLGKKLLVAPLAGQMEQKSNAIALHDLGYGTTTDKFSKDIIGRWLLLPNPTPLIYPDVAKALTDWLIQTGGENFSSLHKSLWGPALDSHPAAAILSQ